MNKLIITASTIIFSGLVIILLTSSWILKNFETETLLNVAAINIVAVISVAIGLVLIYGERGQSRFSGRT